MRTDAHHSSIAATVALAQRFRCRSCSNITEVGDVRIKDRLVGEGTPLLRLADSGYDPISEDELRCGGGCNSDDLTIIA
jgi:hypothetical protein